MEASLEESMDSDHASSPISKPDARAEETPVGKKCATSAALLGELRRHFQK